MDLVTSVLDLLYDYVTPEQLEMLKVVLATLSALGVGKFAFGRLSWEAPAVFNWTRRHWRDLESDRAVKTVTAPAPLIGDSFPLWGGALAGWFAAPGDPLTCSVWGGLLVSLMTYFVLGLRKKRTFEEAVREGLLDYTRFQRHTNLVHENLRKEVDDLSTGDLTRMVEATSLRDRLTNQGGTLAEQAVQIQQTERALQESRAMFDDLRRDQMMICELLTGEDQRSLKSILEASLRECTQEIREHCDGEIKKCFSLIEALSPEMSLLELDLDEEEAILLGVNPSGISLDDTQEIPTYDLEEKEDRRERRRRGGQVGC